MFCLYFTLFFILFFSVFKTLQINSENSIVCGGVLTGGSAQQVCINDYDVTKEIKCSITDFRCNYNKIKQEYTNKKWYKILNNNRAFAKLLSLTPPTFERIIHDNYTQVNCTENTKRLNEIDELLGKNNLILTDIKKLQNVFLKNGNLKIIDFNIFPENLRFLIEKLDKYSKLLNNTSNIYGQDNLDGWVC